MGSYRAIHKILSFIGHHSNRPGQDGQGTITNLMADLPAIPQVLLEICAGNTMPRRLSRHCPPRNDPFGGCRGSKARRIRDL
jgi:hypothetical protein